MNISESGVIKCIFLCDVSIPVTGMRNSVDLITVDYLCFPVKQALSK